MDETLNKEDCSFKFWVSLMKSKCHGGVVVNVIARSTYNTFLCCLDF